MILKNLKPIGVLILLFGIATGVSAQNFIKDYRDFLIRNAKHLTKKQIDNIDISVKRLSLTINRYEKESKHSFFNADTVFIVGSYGVETGSTSEIIWNNNASCYYQCNYELDESKKVKPKLAIETDASEILKAFDPEFRLIVELGDTAGYRKYAYKHRVYDGEAVSSVMAIKKEAKWNFTIFKGVGWAMDCYNSFRQQDKSADIDTIINNLTNRYFGCRFDSVDTAYRNDHDKRKNRQTLPIILLNGKVSDYSQLENIKLYRIKSISVWTKNSHNPAIPNGISTEFGIIALSVDDKAN